MFALEKKLWSYDLSNEIFWRKSSIHMKMNIWMSPDRVRIFWLLLRKLHFWAETFFQNAVKPFLCPTPPFKVFKTSVWVHRLRSKNNWDRATSQTKYFWGKVDFPWKSKFWGFQIEVEYSDKSSFCWPNFIVKTLQNFFFGYRISLPSPYSSI